jgi:hypothetical protein
MFPFSIWLFFRQLRVCWCGAPSLTWSRVCSFKFLPGIASAAFLRSESHGTQEHILLSLVFRLPQPGGPGSCIEVKLKLICDWRSVGQSALVSGFHLEPMTSFCFLSDDCWILDVGHPLWREDGSVIYLYNCFWALPEQSLLGRSPADSPTWRARSSYLYPPGTGWPSYTSGHWVSFCRLLRLALVNDVTKLHGETPSGVRSVSTNL